MSGSVRRVMSSPQVTEYDVETSATYTFTNNTTSPTVLTGVPFGPSGHVVVTVLQFINGHLHKQTVGVTVAGISAVKRSGYLRATEYSADFSVWEAQVGVSSGTVVITPTPLVPTPFGSGTAIIYTLNAPLGAPSFTFGSALMSYTAATNINKYKDGFTIGMGTGYQGTPFITGINDLRYSSWNYTQRTEVPTATVTASVTYGYATQWYNQAIHLASWNAPTP